MAQKVQAEPILATDQGQAWATCSVCGFRYDPKQNPSCGSCPLHSGCTMTCCPNCGVSNIDPSQSRTAVWVKKLFKGASHG